MLKSASTITSLLLFEQLKALPGVERMLSDNLKPEEEEAIRKYYCRRLLRMIIKI